MPGMNLRLQKLKETRDLRYIYENELDKSCFGHDMGYGYFQGLASRTASDKILCVKHFILLKILNMMAIKEALLRWFIYFLI